MKNRELVAYCQKAKCEGCDYESECNEFCKAYHFSPYSGEKESDEFLDREVGETDE